MIQLIATGRAARVTVNEPITAGSVGIPVEVELSNEFDGLETWLVFDAGYKSADIALTGAPVTVPPQVVRVAGEKLKMGVYGAKPDGTVVIPTVWVDCGTVREGVEPSGFDPGDPAPSWPAQVQAIAMEALEVAQGVGGRVTSLDETELAYRTVDAVGIPTYVSDVSAYEDYGITETGWYCFVRIKAKDGAKVTSATVVEGAAGSIVTVGEDHVDVAVRFEVAALSQTVTVTWAEGNAETFVMAAPDLAVRNLDYRTTFYIYDLEKYATWEFEPATDATFTSDHFYYLPDGEGGYELAEVVIGDPVPADTYYKHSRVTLEGMPRNITYRLNTVVDCPMTIVLPDVADDGYGCWYELSVRRNGSYSLTLVPPSDAVKIASNGITSFTAGIDVTDLHYSNVGGVEAWRATNTHSNFTVPDPTVTGLTIRKPPTKVEYAAGEALDLTGIEVLLDFADGNSRLLTDTDFTDPTKMTFAPAIGAAVEAGTTELVITYASAYGTFTASTPITVTGGE